MKKQNIFLIFAILLTSCTQAQPPATPTFAPTTTPIPSATATLTPIPTVTNTPTEVPIPEHEFQVTDADGNTILVVNDTLYKWENSKLVPVEMENTTFENAIDASNAAQALAPKEYFEGDQQALKDILFPLGVKVNQLLEQMAFKTLSSEDNGLTHLPLYGIPVSITKVQAEPSDKFQLIVVNMAVLGVDQPVPIVIGKVESGTNLFVINGYENKKLIDNPLQSTSGSDFRGIQDYVSFFKGLFGEPVVITATWFFNSEKYSRDTRWPVDTAVIEFKEYLFKRMETTWNKILVDIGGWPTPPFKASSGWINWDLNSASGYDFDGYAIDRLTTYKK